MTDTPTNAPVDAGTDSVDNRWAFTHQVSNRCGITLMNTEVGMVVADVMRQKPNVEISEFPSMIRVDGTGRIEFEYEEITEQLGTEYFGTADLEEVMSTHYGRMIHTDDRTILVANPEDAAEELGFDLQEVK